MSAPTTRREAAAQLTALDAVLDATATSSTPAAPRVNLLPPEVLARRAVRRVQRGAAAAAAGTVLVVAAAWAVGASHVSAEQDRLDAANQRVQALQAQQAQYAEAPAVIAQVEAAEQARAGALSQDVAWYRYVDSLTRALPASSWLTGVQVSLSTAGTAAASTGAATDPTAAPATGTVSITARSTSYEDVAAYLDALAEVPGVADAYLTTSTRDDSAATPVISFTVTAEVTADALSHRYDQEAD